MAFSLSSVHIPLKTVRGTRSPNFKKHTKSPLNAYKRESAEICERNFYTKDIHKSKPLSNSEKLKGMWDKTSGQFSG